MPCRVVHAASLSLSPAPLDPAQVVSGAPEVEAAEVVSDAVREVGVWQHGPGVSTDVEADEVFVVLSGRATVTVLPPVGAEGADGAEGAGGDALVLELGPGDIGVLEAGARTRWEVHETLRKVYVLGPAGTEGPSGTDG